jgi:molybdate transport repressor ModE-like protein
MLARAWSSPARCREVGKIQVWLVSAYPGQVELSAHVPDLAALGVLLSVAQAGSLNSAARQIGVSQQAVSARIRAMEAQTGVALVRRTPRGSSLTAEGAVIAEWAAAALAAALGPGAGQAPAALSLSTTAAVRAAVLAGAAPAVISELAVADDLTAGRLIETRAPELDLRRALRAIWAGAKDPPAGAARDLVAHILSRRPARPQGAAPA